MKFAPTIAMLCCTISCFSHINSMLSIEEVIKHMHDQQAATESMCISDKYQTMLTQGVASMAKIAHDPRLKENKAAQIYRGIHEGLQRDGGFDRVFSETIEFGQVTDIQYASMCLFCRVTLDGGFQICLQSAFNCVLRHQEADGEWKRARKVGLHICSSILTDRSGGALRFPLDEPKTHDEFIERFFTPNANIKPEHTTSIKMGLLNIYAFMQLTDACKEAAIKARTKILQPATAETTSTPQQ